LFILPKRISELQNNIHFQILVYIKTPPRNFMFVNPSTFSDLGGRTAAPKSTPKATIKEEKKVGKEQPAAKKDAKVRNSELITLG